MAEYYPEQYHITHFNLNISNKIKVEETIDIPNNESIFHIYFERKVGSASASSSDRGRASIKIKDYTDVGDCIINCPGLEPNTEHKYKIFTFRLKHNSKGRGKYSFEINIKCDEKILLYGTYITAKVENRDFIPIDQSAPAISSVTVKSDRYGKNASASFAAAHESYPLTNIQFTLSGLTSEQWYERYCNRNSGSDRRDFNNNKDGTYSVTYIKNSNLSNFTEVEFDLDAREDGACPLDSGGRYGYTLTVTAQNGKTTTITGELIVPQKVTGILCETTLNLKQETTEYLEYTVIPFNAELTSVKFHSSETSVATVDENGLITAVSDGVTTITVTTVDGSFASSCIVSVYNTDKFLHLSELNILTAKDISKLSYDCNFLRGKMIEKGTDVPVFIPINNINRNYPVIKIQLLLEAIETNCQILKASSTAAGVVTESLPSPQTILKQNINWYIVINEWIAFLNELNGKLN